MLIRRHVFFFALLLPVHSLCMYEKLANENLQTVPAEKRESHNFFSNTEFATWICERQQHLELRPKREMVFEILGAVERKRAEKTNASVLDDMTRQDLNLVAGTRTNQSAYLAAYIDRTQTEFGKCALMHMLANPLADSADLEPRQAVIRELVQNAALYQRLETALAQVKVAEDLMLTFWLPDDPLKGMLLQKYIRIPGCQNISDQLNREWWALELTERLNEIGTGAWAGIQGAGAVLLPTVAVMTLAGYKDKAVAMKDWALKKARVSTVVNLFTVWGTAAWLAQKILPGCVTNVLNDVGAAAFYGVGLSWTYDMLRGEMIMFAALQQRLTAMARVLDSLREIDALAEQYPEFAARMPACRVVHKVLVDLPLEQHDLKKLLDLLGAWTFLGEPSRFSRFGVILAAFKLMNENKDHFDEALAALGEIDAHLSIARLYQEGQGRANTWCFVEYHDHAQMCPVPAMFESGQCRVNDALAPQLVLEDFWSPMLEPTRAVSNSLMMGTGANPRAIIVTGPNAGGKSTITRGAILSALLAQTIGLVPARRCVLTPFVCIVAYLNIVDDIAAGNSHFKAGVKRAHDVIEQVDQARKEGNVLVALDEVFDGTSHAEGQAAAYSLVEHVAKQPHALCLAITHYPLLAQLEAMEPALYKNNKVSVASSADGRLAYPYKLEPGVADQYIALDVLRDEGFSSSLLARARELIQA